MHYLMFDSPPALRTRNRLADRKRSRRSLSLDSAPSDILSETAVNSSTVGEMANNKLIEDCVNKFLSKDSIFEKLTAKLSEHITSTVERVLSESLTKFKEELFNLHKEVATLKERVAQLDHRLDCKTDDLEQYQRRNNLRIFGVRETIKENTDQLVLDIVREKMGVELKVEAIERSHRVGAKPRPRDDGTTPHRPIIVRFCSYRDRRRVFEEKKKLKGTGITFKEDLTVRRLEVLRTAVDKFGVRNTWTVDGKVFWLDKGTRGSATKLTDFTTA